LPIVRHIDNRNIFSVILEGEGASYEWGDAMAASSIEILIAIGVGVWSATNIVFNAANIMNERRDTIITGYIKDRQITVEHKQLILNSDWLPMAIGVALLGLGGIALVSCLPWLLPDLGWRTPKLWCATGLVFFLGVGGTWIVNGYKEFKVMKQSADTAPVSTIEKQFDEQRVG
jgi:hypothetical protein